MSKSIMITQADINDLDSLHEIERLCFPPEKAADRGAFEYRLTRFPKWFLKAELDGRTVGLINGSSSERPYITDDLYDEDSDYDDSGENLLIYGLAVHPDFQHNGIAHRLMAAFVDLAKSAGNGIMCGTV